MAHDAIHPFRAAAKESMESDENPYVAPNHAEDYDAAWFQGSVLAFVRKVLVTLVWTLLFFFGSAIFLGFVIGIYFVNMSAKASEPSQRTIETIGFVGSLIPLAMGCIAILLGMLGYLPGTRSKA